ncbi:MAG: fluoride efflux transporter CrcB [Candidatus Marinimicrobia bacterium]|nr:fluoride efflux transporter CrcB [Candidatus Neomarinimicrobiota bacterium]
MTNYLLAAAGAALGGALRYGLSGFAQKILPPNFPYGTLAVNVLGTFILGFIIFYFDVQGLISPRLRLFLTIGFCGGFTTFSTFAFETTELLRDAEYLLAFANVGLNLFLTLGALAVAYISAKWMIGG